MKGPVPVYMLCITRNFKSVQQNIVSPSRFSLQSQGFQVGNHRIDERFEINQSAGFAVPDEGEIQVSRTMVDRPPSGKPTRNRYRILSQPGIVDLGHSILMLSDHNRSPG